MRGIPRTTRIAIVVTGIFVTLGSVMVNIGAPALTWLSPKVALVLFILISLFLIGVSLWHERQKAASEPSAADAHNRQFMLSRVENTWITDFLENPLYYSYDEQLLPLLLRKRVGSRFDLVLSNPLEPARTNPSDTTITQVFDQAGGELLILGEPGAGKTTLLLELARDLLKRAKDNEAAPIPVVLMLSSWATRKLPLERWIVKELETKYSIPSWIGKEWVRANQLLLLLDGLDEVAPSALPACIEAINKYYHQKCRSLVVCSRTKEFLDQRGRLALYTAVTVQPLSSEQVDAYLDDLAAKGEDVEGLKHALHQSDALRALATTPLLLTVFILAYHGKPVQETLARVKATPPDQQHLIFHDYVERMLQREGTRIHAPAQQTKQWLAWLADELTDRSQTEFYLERLQPDWLPKRRRAFYRGSIGPVIGLLAALFFGLLARLSIKLFAVLLCVLFIRLFFWLVFVLADGEDTEIELAETWSRERLSLGLLAGLVGGLVGGLSLGLSSGLLGVLSNGLLCGLFCALFGRRSILSPNEEIGLSLKSGLVVGLVVGLVAGLLDGLVAGLLDGLVAALFFGLLATLQHYTLRFLLWQARCTPAPWQVVPFLEDAVEQLLLRKVGGGYIFRHRLLQDYFASLNVVPPHDLSS